MPTPTANKVGPHPSYIQVSKPYIFQQQLSNRLVAIGANPTREDHFRLQGVQWINDVRTVLHLTFSTAICYYHKFRLFHKDSEYLFQDATAAALLTACKIEDTLKKSREILCAAWNLKEPVAADHLSPDDPTFETASKNVIGLERLMLEASSFDFRSRYPQKHLIKLAKETRLEKSVTKLAYQIMIDLYKTFAPLKQSCAAMSFGCIELATLILEQQQDAIRGVQAPRYKRWRMKREEVVETMLDLLDLYTHFQKATAVGPVYNIDKFINIRIKLNQELEGGVGTLCRYTEYHDSPKTNGNGIRSKIKTPKTPVTPASPADTRINGVSPGTLSPRSSGSGRQGRGATAQNGTYRYISDKEQANHEKAMVAKFFEVEYEEYVIDVDEVEETPPPTRNDRHNGPHRDIRNGRDDRFHYNKRIRR